MRLLLYSLFAVPQSINAIYDEVIKREGGLGMDLERIRASLDDLGCEAPLMEIDETYSVGMHIYQHMIFHCNIILRKSSNPCGSKFLISRYDLTDSYV